LQAVLEHHYRIAELAPVGGATPPRSLQRISAAVNLVPARADRPLLAEIMR
jgi:hypothetical protein